MPGTRKRAIFLSLIRAYVTAESTWRERHLTFQGAYDIKYYSLSYNRYYVMN